MSNVISSYKNKIIASTVILLITITSIFLFSSDITIDEGFDSINSDWVLQTWYWENGYRNAGITIQEHAFDFNNGYLESKGNFNPDKFNSAMVSQDYIIGAWRLIVSFPQVNITSPPETPGLANFFVWISDLSTNHGEIGDSISCCGTGLGVGFTIQNVVVAKTHVYFPLEIPIELQVFDTFKVYNIISTGTHVGIFIDSQFIGQVEVATNIVVRSLMLGSVHGTFVKYDSLQATQNYERVCKELGYECSDGMFTPLNED